MAGHEAHPPSTEEFSERNFTHHPDYSAYFNSNEIEIPLENWTHIACPYSRCQCCGHLQPHTNTLIITIAGLASPSLSSNTNAPTNAPTGPRNANAPIDAPSEPRSHRLNNPAMAIGVQFRTQGFNLSIPIQRDPSPTKLKADLLATIQALDVVRKLTQPGALPVQGLCDLKHVVIKTDDGALVRGVCAWRGVNRPGAGSSVGKYGIRESQLGGLDREMRDYAPLMVIVDAMVNEINASGVLVQFWRVGEARVEGARGLAGEAMTRRDVVKGPGLKGFGGK